MGERATWTKNVKTIVLKVFITTTHDFLVVCDENVINFAHHETNWIVDNGVSFHVTSYTLGHYGVELVND